MFDILKPTRVFSAIKSKTVVPLRRNLKEMADVARDMANAAIDGRTGQPRIAANRNTAPSDEDTLKLADRLIKQKKYQDALNHLDGLLDRPRSSIFEADRAQANCLKGFCLLCLDKDSEMKKPVQEALVFFEKNIEKNKGSKKDKEKAATCYFLMASRYYNRYVNEKDLNRKNYFLDKSEEKIKNAKKLIDVNDLKASESNSEILFLNSCILMQRELKQERFSSATIRLAEMASYLKPQDINFLSHLKNLYLHNRNFQSAKSTLEAIKRLYEEQGSDMDYQAMIFLSFCHLLRREYDAAILVLNSIIDPIKGAVIEREQHEIVLKCIALVLIVNLYEKQKKGIIDDQICADGVYQINQYYLELDQESQGLDLLLGQAIVAHLSQSSDNFDMRELAKNKMRQHIFGKLNFIPEEISFYILAVIAGYYFQDSFFVNEDQNLVMNKLKLDPRMTNSSLLNDLAKEKQPLSRSTFAGDREFPPNMSPTHEAPQQSVPPSYNPGLFGSAPNVSPGDPQRSNPSSNSSRWSAEARGFEPATFSGRFSQSGPSNSQPQSPPHQAYSSPPHGAFFSPMPPLQGSNSANYFNRGAVAPNASSQPGPSSSYTKRPSNFHGD